MTTMAAWRYSSISRKVDVPEYLGRDDGMKPYVRTQTSPALVVLMARMGHEYIAGVLHAKHVVQDAVRRLRAGMATLPQVTWAWGEYRRAQAADRPVRQIRRILSAMAPRTWRTWVPADGTWDSASAPLHVHAMGAPPTQSPETWLREVTEGGIADVCTSVVVDGLRIFRNGGLIMDAMAPGAVRAAYSADAWTAQSDDGSRFIDRDDRVWLPDLSTYGADLVADLTYPSGYNEVIVDLADARVRVVGVAVTRHAYAQEWVAYARRHHLPLVWIG